MIFHDEDGVHMSEADYAQLYDVAQFAQSAAEEIRTAGIYRLEHPAMEVLRAAVDKRLEQEVIIRLGALRELMEYFLDNGYQIRKDWRERLKMSDHIKVRTLKQVDGPVMALYTTEQVLGAWRNGTRVRKIHSDHTDAHQDGALGTVIGSLRGEGDLVYFVEWDDRKGVPVGIVGTRIEMAR